MKIHMKLNWLILILFAGLGCQAASLRSEFAAGREYYAAGEFKLAAAQFQRALQTNPNDAESYYWMGMSYQALADIAAPFGGKYTSRARVYLTKATELAPSRADYRRELFDFLLDSIASRAARRQAADILMSVPECDPDSGDMRRRFQEGRKTNSSAEARLGRLFLAAPQLAVRIVELPASAGRNAAPPVFAVR
jgi:tetratricopeptide (TPR) repeat protein